MPRYLPPETAPRDGTIIVGLFARSGKRNVSFAAAYDVESASDTEPPPAAAQQWIHDAHQRHLERLRTDPTWFFRPISDSDAAFECGRMVGWRPAARYNPPGRSG